MVSPKLRMKSSICASVCARAEASSSRPPVAGQRGLLQDRAHQLEAAHQALDVVALGEEVGVDPRCRQRIGAGQRDAAAALGPQQAYVARVAVAERGLAAMVDQLADHEVQLQVGCRCVGPALDEAAGLGEVGGQHAAALAPPLEDAAARRARRRRTTGRTGLSGAARRPPARHRGGRAGGGRRQAARAPARCRGCASSSAGPMPDSISTCGDCSAPAHSSTSRAALQTLHAGRPA